MMTSTKSKSFDIAFLVDEAAIKRIVNVLTEASNELEFKTTCNDGSDINFKSLDGLLSFPNIKLREIKSITISSPWKSQLRINLKLSNEKYAPVRYEISGEDKEVFYFSGKIEEYIQSICQWYSKLTFTDFVDFFLGAIVIAFIILFVYAIFKLGFSDLNTPIGKTETTKDLLIKSVIYLFPLVVAFVGWLFNFLKKRVFPVGIFAIGEGLKRYKDLVFLRQLLAEGVGLSMIIGIIVNLITK